MPLVFSYQLKLKQKFLLYFLAIIIPVFLLILSVTVLITRNKLLIIQQSKARSITVSLAASCSGLVKTQQWEAVASTLREIKNNDRDIQYALFLLNNGECVISSEEALKGKYLNANAFEKKALETKKIRIFRDPRKKDMYEAVVSVVVDGEKAGVLRIGYTTRYVLSDIENIIVIMMFIGFFAVTAGAAVYYFVIQRNIIQPLSNILSIIKQVSDGDLSEKKIGAAGSDEMGEFSKNFMQRDKKLREMVSQVRHTADQVAHALQETSSTLEQMNTSTQGVSQAITQVSKGASTQAAHLEETSSVMQKASLSLKEVVANAQSANTSVNQTASRIENGRLAAKEAVDRIERLTIAVLETSSVIQGLGQMSQQISAITETITSIADQTNLLALNAAIEAARAGEAGRGFAVVAEEVRKLAEGAAESVRKIGGLIKLIQTETNHAVSAIEVSSKEVKGGKEQIIKIAEVLGEMNKAAQEATGFVTLIAQAGQERFEEIERIVGAINEVAGISKESASTIQEITATTEKQTASMQEVSASTQSIAQLAEELRELVGKFKLE